MLEYNFKFEYLSRLPRRKQIKIELRLGGMSQRVIRIIPSNMCHGKFCPKKQNPKSQVIHSLHADYTPDEKRQGV